MKPRQRRDTHKEEAVKDYQIPAAEIIRLRLNNAITTDATGPLDDPEVSLESYNDLE